MQSELKCVKLVVKNGWTICPICGKGKLFPLLPTTVVRDLPCKCKRCGQESIANIDVPEPESKETSA